MTHDTQPTTSNASEDHKETTPQEIVEFAKGQVESSAESEAKYGNEQAGFFAGCRAAYADIVFEFGDDEDFEEALARGSDAARAGYDDKEVSDSE